MYFSVNGGMKMIQMMNIVANIFQLFAVYLFMDNMLKKKYKTKYMILFWIIEIAIDEYVAMKDRKSVV